MRLIRGTPPRVNLLEKSVETHGKEEQYKKNTI